MVIIINDIRSNFVATPLSPLTPTILFFDVQSFFYLWLKSTSERLCNARTLSDSLMRNDML